MSKSWRRGEKEHLFYATSPSGCFWIWRLLERKRVHLRNANNLADNQEQVAVISVASVVKTSTFSCCSGKSRISNKNSNSSSSECTQNEINELIAIWEKEEALYNIRHPDYSTKQERNNGT